MKVTKAETEGLEYRKLKVTNTKNWRSWIQKQQQNRAWNSHKNWFNSPLLISRNPPTNHIKRNNSKNHICEFTSFLSSAYYVLFSVCSVELYMHFYFRLSSVTFLCFISLLKCFNYRYAAVFQIRLLCRYIVIVSQSVIQG